ncbi:MAG: hypothetical protein U5R31_07550 [Acidimicrobiia bacterium]|nr:hypothetical protein [Acidimicrobiia bacterium]
MTKAFTRYDFSVMSDGEVVDDQLERQWGRIERMALPRIGGLYAAPVVLPEDQIAVRDLVALHFARSYVVLDAFDDAWKRRMSPLPERLYAKPEIRDQFAFETGAAPEDAAIREWIRDWVEVQRRRNISFVERQADLYNGFRSDPHDRRACRRREPRSGAFVVPDSPILLGFGNTLHRPGGQLKLRDEDMILMPLTRNVLATIGDRHVGPERSAEDVAEGQPGTGQREAIRWVAFDPCTGPRTRAEIRSVETPGRPTNEFGELTLEPDRRMVGAPANVATHGSRHSPDISASPPSPGGTLPPAHNPLPGRGASCREPHAAATHRSRPAWRCDRGEYRERRVRRTDGSSPITDVARLNARHLDARRTLTPREYLTEPWAFGERPSAVQIPEAGDAASARVAAVQHLLVLEWRRGGTRPGNLCRAFGFSRNIWSLTLRGHRWAGETVLAALASRLVDPDVR